MPKQSENNNHTSKIIVFPVSHTIFYLLKDEKMHMIAPHGAIKSTLWPNIRKNHIFKTDTNLILFYACQAEHKSPFFAQ